MLPYYRIHAQRHDQNAPDNEPGREVGSTKSPNARWRGEATRRGREVRPRGRAVRVARGGEVRMRDEVGEVKVRGIQERPRGREECASWTARWVRPRGEGEVRPRGREVRTRGRDVARRGRGQGREVTKRAQPCWLFQVLSAFGFRDLYLVVIS